MVWPNTEDRCLMGGDLTHLDAHSVARLRSLHLIHHTAVVEFVRRVLVACPVFDRNDRLMDHLGSVVNGRDAGDVAAVVREDARRAVAATEDQEQAAGALSVAFASAALYHGCMACSLSAKGERSYEALVRHLLGCFTASANAAELEPGSEHVMINGALLHVDDAMSTDIADVVLRRLHVAAA